MIDEKLVEEVIRTLEDQGELTKNQILTTWGIAEENYKELQKLILKKSDSISAGPQKVGGFVIGKRKGKFPDEAISDRFWIRETWEQQGIQRLVELLQHSDLEDLLGSLLQTIRQVRKAETGIDRRGTKIELATALILQHGKDLFCEKLIKQKVAKACNIANPPEKWHPGKTAAIEFVDQTRFPHDFAGIPTPEKLPDYEYLEGRFKALWYLPWKTTRCRHLNWSGRAI